MSMSLLGSCLLVLYFALLLVFSSLRTRIFSHRAIILFRAFFPSWKFFDEISPSPHLFFRTSKLGEDWSDWRETPRVDRKKNALFLNAEVNLKMSLDSVLERLISEIEEMNENEIDVLEKSVSFGLVKNAVKSFIPLDLNAGTQFQFKICLSQKTVEDVLISPAYEA